MKFFISHSSKNRDLVYTFVDLLNSKLGVAESEIYCTSIKNQVKLGKNFIQDIHENLKDAEVVFFIITEDYLNSVFCLMEMGAAWAYKENIIPILVPPVSFKTLDGTPLSPIQSYSLADINDIGTVLYDNLVDCHAIQRLSRAKEQEFLLSLPDFVARVKQCLADMSGRKQVENAVFLPIAQNGNSKAIAITQAKNQAEMDVDLRIDPLFGACIFVSAVSQFFPYLNWSALRDTNASLMYRVTSSDETVKAVTVEIKSTSRMIKCFEYQYELAHGKRDIIIRLDEIKNPALLNEIAEICFVIRPENVPDQTGRLTVEMLGLYYE